MQLIIKTNDLRLKILNEISNLNADRVYIYGNGTYSRIIREFLQTEGKFQGWIRTIVDDEFYFVEETSSIPFSQFMKMEEEKVPIIFGFYNYKVIQKKKEELSSKFCCLYDFHFTVVNGKRLYWDAILAKERQTAYQQTYAMLSDVQSRKVMQLYLNAATVGEFHELFSQCYEEPSYFNHITQNLKVDTLIDCGAYDGDTVHDFVTVFPNYKRIIAIEPDPLNYEKLSCRKERENIRDLFIVRKGVGACNGCVHFQVNGSSNSYQAESGNSEIQITTLDAFGDDTIGTVMLKMDIEGAELDALHGAQNLIKEQTPVLAICVYHKEEDLIEIPQFINKTVGNDVYDYFLGFHGLDLAELVFYAIPKRIT